MSEKNLGQWLGEKNLPKAMVRSLLKHDDNGKSWVAMFDTNVETQAGIIMLDEFRRLFCMFVKRGEGEQFIEGLKRQREIDFDIFWPAEFDSRVCLDEGHLGDIWQAGLPCGRHKFATPIAYYRLGSGVDKRVSDGFSGYAPQKWLVDSLDLVMSDEGPNTWVDRSGNVAIQAKGAMEKQSAVVIDERFLHSLIDRFGVDPVWIAIAERDLLVNRKSEARRKLEGIVWLDGASWRGVYRDLDNPLLESKSGVWSELPV